MGTRLIEKRMIQSNGHFRQATIEQKNTFTNPVALGKLGLFVVDAHKEHMESMGRKHKYRELPLILASLCDVRNSYMVVGIPQNKRVSTRKGNRFGHAFQEARTKVEARARHSGFETAVIEIQRDDYDKFVTYLQSGLRS